MTPPSPSPAMLAVARPAAMPVREIAALRTTPLVLQWTSHVQNGGRVPHHLMLAIELISATSAMVEAWVQRGDSQDRRVLLPRRALTAEVCQRDGLLHIDIFNDNGNTASTRIAAISLLDAHTDIQRPLFAQTALLTSAGFHGGGYDAPKLAKDTLAHRKLRD